MIEVLRNGVEYHNAREIAKQHSKDLECTKYVAYVARTNRFKISDWYDDATITSFTCGNETSF
jgi:hypothetical protein